MNRRLGAALALALLAGCAAGSGIGTAGKGGGGLPAYFDCLRDRGETVVSAHRGGPAAGRPENGLAAIRATLDANRHAIVEIDVSRSADGVLFLLHDDRLDRTTSGTGRAAARGWAELAPLRLRDADGRLVAETVPTLADALALIVARRAVVTLDVKRPAPGAPPPFAEVIAAVRAAGAAGHAAIITYNLADAALVARLAPELMVSADIAEVAAADAHAAAGLAPDRTLAWTGTRQPSPALFAALRQRGIEPMFGTLGRPGVRLDDAWLADGDPAEYRDLARSGAVVIATDRADVVGAALSPATCPLPARWP